MVQGEHSWEAGCLENETSFVERVRSLTVPIPGPCVLDLCGANALRCAGFSSFDLTLKELQLVLPHDIVSNVLVACKDSHVSECFAVRNELVNFKKLCLHLYHDMQAVDSSLRRFSSLFFCDVVNTPEDAPQLQRYSRLCGATMHCKGRMRVLLDLREQCKYICSIPRHLDLDFAFPSELCAFPSSLGVAGLIGRAEAFVREARGETAGVTDDEAGSPAGKSGPELSGSQAHDPDPFCVSGFIQLMGGVRERCPALPPHVLRYLEQLLTARGVMKATRIHACARKLLRALEQLRDRARRVLACFDVVAEFRCVVNCVAPPPAGSTGSVRRRMHSDMHGNILRGALPVLEEACTVVAAIFEARPCRMFSSGDQVSGNLLRARTGSDEEGSTLLTQLNAVPSEVATVLSDAAADYSSLMVAPDWSWPPSSCQLKATARCPKGKATHRCHICGLLFAKFWVISSSGRVGAQLHCCAQCEANCRQNDRCPFDRARSCPTATGSDGDGAGGPKKSRHNKNAGSKGCPGSVAWCSHKKVCFFCEGGAADEPGEGSGCMQCLLVRGTGEAVLGMVRDLGSRVRLVFLDFDQTLATTKRGENPLPPVAETATGAAASVQGGKSRPRHTVDPHLRELCAGACAMTYVVHVVTRNSHEGPIVEFLVREGCFADSAQVNVHVLKAKSGIAKLDHIGAIMRECDVSGDKGAPVALFADDSLVELLPKPGDSPFDCPHPRLLRVLFTQ